MNFFSKKQRRYLHYATAVNRHDNVVLSSQFKQHAFKYILLLIAFLVICIFAIILKSFVLTAIAMITLIFFIFKVSHPKDSIKLDKDYHNIDYHKP